MRLGQEGGAGSGGGGNGQFRPQGPPGSAAMWDEGQTGYRVQWGSEDRQGRVRCWDWWAVTSPLNSRT